MKKESKNLEENIHFAEIPSYLLQQITDLEKTIHDDTGKHVILVAYEQSEENSQDFTD